MTRNQLFSNVVLNYLKNNGNISCLKDCAVRYFKINPKTAEELLLTERSIILDRGYKEYDYAFYPYNQFNKMMLICSQDLELLTISELLIYYELIGLYIKNKSRAISMLESKKELIDKLKYYRMKIVEYMKKREEVLDEIVYRLNVVQMNNPNWYLDVLRICRNELLKNQHLVKNATKRKSIYVKRLKVNQI